jgi:gliding motility-associated lipoprotein GldD
MNKPVGSWRLAAGSIAFVLCGAFILACNSPFTANPRGYFQVQFPKKAYRLFDQPGYPYSFEYPVYSNVVKDTTFFGEAPENPWWINIDFPQFSGKIYISYKQVGPNKFDKLVSDAFNLTYKHTQKADALNDSLVRTPNGVGGMFFDVSGDVATAYQFFLTDSTKHFIRGALYFEATPNKDSIAPMNSFVAEDMRHLINTFRWKN